MVHDQAVVVFDDENVVVNAGVVLPTVLLDRLGAHDVVAENVKLGNRPGAANAGRKVMTIVSAMTLGADCIDDCGVLRSGQTAAVLAQAPAAPSTLGTFLRLFAFGYARQLDRVLELLLVRAWELGAGPADGERLVIDIDSTICPTHGTKKEGQAIGYTKVHGYHPLLATRAGTGEVLHVRLRKGSANTQRGIGRFVDELIAKINRAGATGPKLLRADSGFQRVKTFQRLERAGWKYSIAARNTSKVRAEIELIDETTWVDLQDYPDSGRAQVAETTYNDRRLVVRRVRTEGPKGQGVLFDSWRTFPIVTNRTDELLVVEREHRQHAVVEQAICDLKDQALAHLPSGKWGANMAWAILACIAHNAMRWIQLLGTPDTTIRTANTIRKRLLLVPGRLTRTGRKVRLSMPARWPWDTEFLRVLQRLRALPAPG